MRRLAAVAFATALASAHLCAQDEAISLRLSPRPNQVIHFTMDHQVSTRIEGAPFEVYGRTVAALTQTVGERDAATGRLESTLAYDTLSMEITLNGNAVPAPAFDLIGKRMTLVYGADGELLDLTPPSAMDAVMAAYAKGMIAALFGGRAGADATLHVGETATVPFAAGMPMPSAAALPLTLNGQTRMKLLSVRRVDGERIAQLDQIVEASMTMIANADTTTTMTMTARGGGGVEWNLDRGYVTTGTTTIEIEAEIMQAKMHGRISTIVRGSN
jgi:hypothetical protein